jgi:bifunctional enzyme CysN/CysC
MSALDREDAALVERDVAAYLERHQNKQLLRFVTVGSVDDGKSTLIGRLLHDTGSIYEDQLAAVKKASQKSGLEVDLALVTDGLKAEREQGITIDVAYRYFTTSRRKFIIADTPGHVQYTRNMATGASTADVAIILVDARHGVLTQTRRHATIAALLGIPHLLVCVNKMDLVGFERERFEALAGDLTRVTDKLGFRGVHAFPVSARDGDNVVSKSPRTPWFEGGTVLGFLETVPVEQGAASLPFRFPVQTVLRPNLDYRGFAGRIAAGSVARGDRVVALPSGKRSTVTGIDTFDGELERAFAPLSVTLRLADEIDLSRGEMLVREGELPRVVQRFEADLVWLSERPLDLGKSYLLKHTTRVTRVDVTQVLSKLDLERVEEVSAVGLGLNDIGKVALAAHRPLFLDAYTDSRGTGAFILVDSLSNDTVAAGMVRAQGGERRDEAVALDRSQVSARERSERLGQSGLVVVLTGPSGSGKTELAYAVERALFDLGRVVTVIDPDDGLGTPSRGLDASRVELARRFAAAGLVAVLSYPAPTEAERAALREAVGETRVLWLEVSDAALPTPECVARGDVERVVARVLGRLTVG